MSRPQLIEWLEKETGQVLERPTEPGRKSRPVSIRVPDELFAQLEVAAARRGETVSQAARRILLAGLTTPTDPEHAIDAAIASLVEARAVIAGSSPSER